MSRPATTHRVDAKKRATRRRQLLAAAVAVAVVLLAVLVAVVSTGEREAAVSADDIAGEPTIVGETLPTAPEDPAADPAVETPVPVVEGADFDGAAVTVGGPGTPQVVLFLASWCPACQQELPEVVTWMDQGGLPDGVGLTSVVTGLDASRPNWPPDVWLEDEGYAGEVLVDDVDGSVAQAYGLSATPFWVAIDAEGQVVARIAGLIDPTQMTALAEAARAAA
jgi:cytochrome c biogenesis protein CcmG, thiol:disulfide interchange protein DsbE